MSFNKSTKLFIGGAAIAAHLLAAPVFADHDDHPETGSAHAASVSDGPYTDWARVLRVEPLHRTVRVSTPRPRSVNSATLHRSRKDSSVGGVAGSPWLMC